MKRRFVFLTVIALLLSAFCASAQSFPVREVTDAQGKTVSTASLVDHKTPFAVTFWASWCKFCRKELDALADQAPDWDRNYRIYAICEDDSRSIARAKALAAGSDWPVTILYDTNGELKRALNVSDIPHSFVFDKDGKQVYSHLGYIPGDEESLIEALENAR